MEYFSEGNGLVIWGIFLLLAGISTIAAFRFSKRRAFTGQAIIPIVMIGFSLLLFAITFSFPSEEAGPALIPRLWGFWTLIFCVSLLIFCIRGTADKPPARGRLGFMAGGIGLTIAYYFSIGIFGYFISSFVFLAVLMYVLSYRKPLTVILVCSGWVVFSYLIFYKLLYIQLPLGFIENLL